MKIKAALHRFKHLLSRRFFIVLLILLQVAFFIFMIFQYSHLRWISTLLRLVSLVTAFHLLMRDDQKPFKLSLIFLLLLFPLLCSSAHPMPSAASPLRTAVVSISR